MSVGTDAIPTDAGPPACCICAQFSIDGARDKSGRFVCAECLDRARQSIIARQARAARAKADARTQAEIDRVESDNSVVLTVKSALDPALALLCASCGRLLHLDTDTCHACGYGVNAAEPPRSFGLFQRRARARRARRVHASHVLILDATWLQERDERLEAALPLACAIPLWTTAALAWWSRPARISAEVLAMGTLALLVAWLVTTVAASRRGWAAVIAVIAVALAATVWVDPFPSIPDARWIVLLLALIASSLVVFLRVRGVFVGLWLVAIAAAISLVIFRAVE